MSTEPERLRDVEQTLVNHDRRLDEHDTLIASIDASLKQLLAELKTWKKLGIALAAGVALGGGGDVAQKLLEAL